MTKYARLILRNATNMSRVAVLPSNASSSHGSRRCFSLAAFPTKNKFQFLRHQQYSCCIQGLLPCETAREEISSYSTIIRLNNAVVTMACKSYHDSAALYSLVHKDAAAAKPTEEELAETVDTIPVWQNPLHHNNHEIKKIFKDDFREDEEIPVIPMPPLEFDPDKVVAPPHIHELAHQIVHLNLLELKELTDKIADHFGFDDEMMAENYSGEGVGQGGGDLTGDGEAEASEERTMFDLKLVGFNAKAKIKVIKEVRSIGGLGLKEAKDLVENAPKVIQKDLKQDKANELKTKLEAVGAQIEIV